MRRAELIRFLAHHGVEFYREGGRHSMFIRASGQKTIAVPRHREVQASTVRQIYKQLGIEPPLER